MTQPYKTETVTISASGTTSTGIDLTDTSGDAAALLTGTVVINWMFIA